MSGNGQSTGVIDRFRLVQCPGCMNVQAVPARYDEVGELYAHMTGHDCFRGGRNV